MFELPKLLITGAQGQLGYELASLSTEGGFEVVSCASASLDICNEAAVSEVLDKHSPQYVINAAGRRPVSIDNRASDLDVNSKGPAILASACDERGMALIQISCAELFNGSAEIAYTEVMEPAPVSDYGQSLWKGEQAVRERAERHIILRTGWLFSARGRSFVRQLLESARVETEVCVADGLMGSPTSAVDLARVVVALIKQLDCDADNWGTYHYCAAEPISWFGFSEAVIAAARQYEDLKLERLVAVHQSELGHHLRPVFSELNCKKILRDFGIHQRSWRTGLMQVARTLYSYSE
ncbi:sugar nucleotide-binding protein [Motiliproteus sp. MSK22-1]|uniref:SDR family oxidoreductase n=1 Tax=Motiliproteus sp. MSK22-1 TaxID=1897630 RepID=UPI0009785B3F|nr:sugar nucleotide-binding protein [Motiliproteus sp. MSK22-1]OMH28422.1 hypothetical protein BGP75_21225 [Motiliproteus sp. MSK22-1]